MMHVLVQHFKTSLDTYREDSFFAPRVVRSWQVFDKYCLKTEASPYYAAAIILHPSRRIGNTKARIYDDVHARTNLCTLKISALVYTITTVIQRQSPILKNYPIHH